MTPNPSSRDRNADLKTLARKVIKDRLSFNEEPLSQHVAEHPDLLPLYVESALGVRTQMNWATATDEECATHKVWSDYCSNLFDSVEEFVLNAIG